MHDIGNKAVNKVKKYFRKLKFVAHSLKICLNMPISDLKNFKKCVFVMEFHILEFLDNS